MWLLPSGSKIQVSAYVTESGWQGNKTPKNICLPYLSWKLIWYEWGSTRSPHCRKILTNQAYLGTSPGQRFLTCDLQVPEELQITSKRSVADKSQKQILLAGGLNGLHGEARVARNRFWDAHIKAVGEALLQSTGTTEPPPWHCSYSGWTGPALAQEEKPVSSALATPRQIFWPASQNNVLLCFSINIQERSSNLFPFSGSATMIDLL